MLSLLQDVRYACRLFRRKPGWTTMAVVTLTLGIGANVAIFSVVNTVLLRKLPLPNPEQVVQVFEDEDQPLNPANFRDLRNGTAEAFSALAACTYPKIVTLTRMGDAVPVSANACTQEIFGVIGLGPILGRAITAADVANDDKVAVVSHAFWRGKLGGDPGAVGRTVVLDGVGWTIVGIMPEGIPFWTSDIWLPLVFTPEQLATRNSRFLSAYGRLRPTVSASQASAALATVMSRIASSSADVRKGRTATAASLDERRVARIRGKLLFLQAVTSVVLLIGCANLANLLLASAGARQRELAVRASIGAGRARLVRQLGTEGLVLAALGAVGGLVLAYWAVPALVASYPGSLPGREAIGVSGPELAVAIGLAFFTSVLFALAPAIVNARPNLANGMKGVTRSGAAGARFVRGALVATEVALALILLSGAGLLVRSFLRLTDQPVGFVPSNVLTAQVTLPAAKYATDDRRRLFFEALIERLSTVPDALVASASTSLPFGMDDMGRAFRGEPLDGKPTVLAVNVRTVSRSYFEALQVPIVRGRGFAASDGPGAEPVAIVNAAFARRYGNTRDVIGLRLQRQANAPWITIVGVSGDTQTTYAAPPRPELFLPLSQSAPVVMRLAVRARATPDRLVPQIRRTVREIDPDLAVTQMASMAELMDTSVTEQRFNMWLLSLFAGLAASLAAIGIFGVMAYLVRLRTREIGIRLALGARPGQIKRMLIRQGLQPMIVGSVAGLIGAWMLSGLLKSQLFQIAPHDPWTLAVATGAFVVIGMTACWLPARQTGTVDPVSVLRVE